MITGSDCHWQCLALERLPRCADTLAVTQWQHWQALPITQGKHSLPASEAGRLVQAG